MVAERPAGRRRAPGRRGPPLAGLREGAGAGRDAGREAVEDRAKGAAGGREWVAAGVEESGEADGRAGCDTTVRSTAT